MIADDFLYVSQEDSAPTKTIKPNNVPVRDNDVEKIQMTPSGSEQPRGNSVVADRSLFNNAQIQDTADSSILSTSDYTSNTVGTLERDFESSLNIRDYFRCNSVTDKTNMGNKIAKKIRYSLQTSSYRGNSDSHELSDHDDVTDLFTSIADQRRPVATKRHSSIEQLLSPKRSVDYDLSSEKSSYQLHVKTDEDIALDICNTFWRPGLTFSTYRHGCGLVCFESLWPHAESLRILLNEAYQATSLRRSVLDITKLALRCAPVTLIQELLVSRIVALDQVFENGSTMLHLACIARNAEVVTFLCNAGINSKAQDKYGRTAEQVCFDSRTRRLLPLNVHRTLSGTGSRAQTPAPKKAPQIHDKEVIFLLAKQMKQYDELQIKLQTLDFDVNVERNEFGDYLIHVVVRGGLCQLPQLLSLVRDQGADVDLCNGDGMTPLMIASADGNAVLVDVLLCILGANPNTPNPLSGFCALHYAAINNSAEVSVILMKRGADYNLEDHTGQRADDFAKLYRSYECEESILRERAERIALLTRQLLNNCLNANDLRVTDLYQTNADGETLIMLAAKLNRVSNLRILIGREGCPIDAQHGATGQTALAMACLNGNVTAAQVLLRHDANVCLKDINGLLPLHHAVLIDHAEVADVILQYQRALIGLHTANKSAKSHRMKNLLRIAIQRRQTEIVTPALFEKSLTGDAEGLFCLLEDGDDINPISGVGNWPIYLAAEYGHLDAVVLLHRLGGDLTRKHPASRNTVLHAVCERGHAQVVKFLLKFCSCKTIDGYLDINGMNNDGKTPLHLAAEKGSRRIVAMLLDHGASTALLNTNGELISCPQYLGIQVLIEKRREDHLRQIVTALKDKKNIANLQAVFETRFDHNLRDTSGDTPLMLACRHNNTLAVKYLLSSACETANAPSMSDSDCDDGDSGISAAPVGGGGDTVFTRLRRSSSTDHRNDTDPRDAWMLASTGHMDMSSRILDIPMKSSKSALLNSDQFDSKIRSKVYSRSTLNLGSDEGSRIHSTFTMMCTNTHVVDVNPIDGRAAIHRAIETGDQLTMIQALIDADQNCVNIQDVHGFSPLHLACKLGRRRVVQKLVALEYVDLNSRTLDGRLPEETTTSKRMILLIKNCRGNVRRSSSLTTSSALDFSDSASQLGGRGSSTVLDFDVLNDRFNRIKEKVFKPDS